MPEQLRITVFGGTGFLGRRVVRHLLAAGHRVRIAARHPDRKPELLQSDRTEAFYADLFDPGTLSAALSDADGAVNAISLYVERGDLTYGAVHVDGAARLATLAREVGIPRFVQLSGIGADPKAADSYIRARGQGEEAVRAALPGATIIRPAVMFGAGDALLSTIRTIARRSPVYPLFGNGRTRLQPVWVGDVAEALARLLAARTSPPCYELAGADILSYRGLVETVAQALELRSRPVPVPLALWKPLAAIAERLPNAPLTRAQVALMQIDNVTSGALPGLASLGITPKGVIAYIGAAETGGFYDDA